MDGSNKNKWYPHKINLYLLVMGFCLHLNIDTYAHKHGFEGTCNGLV